MPLFPLLYLRVTLSPLPTQDLPDISLDPRFHAPTRHTNHVITMGLPNCAQIQYTHTALLPFLQLPVAALQSHVLLIYTIGICSQSANFVTTDSKYISTKLPCTSPILTPLYMAVETPPMGSIILRSTPNIHPLPLGRVPSLMRK